MPNSRAQTSLDFSKLLSFAFKSEDVFVKEYRKVDETTARELYLHVLFGLKQTTLEGNIDDFNNWINVVACISNVETSAKLKNYYDDTDNSIKHTNLVILACKHNKVGILKHVFGIYSQILKNLSIDVGKATITPNDEDETCHNAFYYAIRSGNVELLDALINWPDNYFDVHVEELDEILSRAYEELKLKNVPLSDETEIFVENKLINMRFFSNAFEQDASFRGNHNNIKERIELVLDNTNLLITKYPNNKEVDEKFLFIANFITQNIHILKQQLKSTYDRVPWEEIEFCLVSFIFSHTKRQEIILFYHATLNKDKILYHLENFAKELEKQKSAIDSMSISKLAVPPKLKREKVVADIICNCPQFEELYSDYQQIRDIHSLEKINDYIKLALSSKPKEKEGQLIIIRVLQVIGEYLKNTLESPKLSNATSELFLLSLPKSTREVIIDLRNSLSHAYSLSGRTEIEENADVAFFIGVQNDTKKVGDVITDILYNRKIKIIRTLLKEIVKSENLKEINAVIKVLGIVNLDKINFQNFDMEHKLEKLIKELDDNMRDKTNYEKNLFDEINNIVNFGKTKLDSVKIDYITAFASLKGMLSFLNGKIDHIAIRGMKFRANDILKNIAPQIKSPNLKAIVDLLMKMFRSVSSRAQDNLVAIEGLIYKIVFIVEFGVDDIKWIEKLKQKLTENSYFIASYKHKLRKFYNITSEKHSSNQLMQKLSELKNIFNKNSLYEMEKLPFYKTDKKLQAVVEMLVLDIMSILGSSKHSLENNLLFLDDNTPLLTGKCLRNHLAHDNALVDVLLSDPTTAIILNAKNLTEKNIVESKKKIGKLVSEDPSKLKEKYDQGLITVTNQEKMFVALEEGNLESLKDCLKKGADIYARNIKYWTTLHFAAKGPNLEILRFICDQISNINLQDVNGQGPLHIAAAYGRKNIVEFLIKETDLHIDSADILGKTPLHIAAENGHRNVVEILLKNKANTFVKDMCGLSPVFHAVRNNHIDAAKVLLKNDENVDINKAIGGFTPLHEAAESGHQELVDFLLQNKADVNAGDDRNWTPLHAAAFNGHTGIVNSLILNRANIDSTVINGCTPLHYTAESGNEEIASILLQHGANVNKVDTAYSTPLHYAANYGHKEIVKTLLKNKANVNVVANNDFTPLHLAARGGHLEIVTSLLKHGANVHVKDKIWKNTPLCYAAEGGHTEVAKLLIKSKAEIDVKTSINFTPLHIATKKSHKDIISLLLKNNAVVNVPDIKGNTALHVAAMNGNKDVIDILTKSKAKLNAKSNSGMTPLHLAALRGHRDAVVFLIEIGAKVNATANYGLTPLHASVMGGHIDVVNFLVKSKADVDAKGVEDSTPLYLAVEGGYKEIVEILIANGSNVNAKHTPLLSSIKRNKKEIVEILIANGANVNAEGGKPLLLAVNAGYKDIVEVLLNNKAYINKKYPESLTALHAAAARGHKEIVNTLVKYGAHVNAIFNYQTPLFIAAVEGYEEIVEILIKNRADMNFKSEEGTTPLQVAAKNGHSNVVKVLLDNNVDINVKDDLNRTALEFAVSDSHLEVVKMLLQSKKVDVNAKGNDDYTVLHIAAQENNLEIVKCLISEGSDINAKNAFGSKPIHIAAKEGQKRNIEFFLSKGSSINDLGAANRNLLHYAVMKGQLEVVKYLIAQGINVNAEEANGLRPIHFAVSNGYKDIVEYLLKNGAAYDVVDKLKRKLSKIAKDADIMILLMSTEKLFEAAKQNSPLRTENCIKAGAFVDTRNSNGETPLFYAAWKGYVEIVNVLLQNKADPNIVNKKGVTPLHYAAKFSHLKVVKTLLSKGAIYTAISDSGKMPPDFTVDQNKSLELSRDKNVTCLLKLVENLFEDAKRGNVEIIDRLKAVKSDEFLAITNARNNQGNTLLQVMIVNKNKTIASALLKLLKDK